MFTDEELSTGKVDDKLISVVEHAENEFNRVDSEYTENREYYEHSQEPAGKPADKEYVTENLLTGLVHRLIGGMIGGRFTPYLSGGGVNALPLRELFLDILEKNKFQKMLVGHMSNFFYVEGLAGLKGNFNSFRRGKYGWGFPEVFVLRPGEILLDQNSVHPFHEDDKIRIHRISQPTEELKQKYPEYADQIVPAYDSDRGEQSTQNYSDLYETQILRTVHKNIDGISREMDEYYIAKVINKNVVVQKPVPHKYRRFTIIPVIHTPRFKTMRYPMGIIERLKDTQDQLNITSSILLEAVKASIKMPFMTTGAKKVDQERVREEMSKPDGYVHIEGSNTRVHQLTANPLVRPVVEYYNLLRHRFEAMSDKFAPDKGDVSGDLSGKAINLLQMRGVEPELVAKSNIENALVELGWFILECIVMKMKSPFNLDRKVEGEDRRIYYNTPLRNTQLTGEDEYNYISNGMVNQMEQVDLSSLELDVEVEMNLLQMQNLEVNKAIMMRNQNSLALQDYMRVMYPKDWKEKLDNLRSEQDALALVAQIEEVRKVNPELVDIAMNQIKQFLQISQ